MPAFGQTKLQIINSVLGRLREAEVATSSITTYAVLVSNVLNTVKTQIEQAWRWYELRDTYALTVIPGTTSYALTSSGQFAQIIDAWNTTIDREVTRGSYAEFNRYFFSVDTVQTGDVQKYNITGLNNAYDLQIDTWPNVTSTNSLSINIYKPLPDPSDSTVILVPNQVLIEGMVAYLMAERGDDSGTAYQAQLDLYKDQLAGAIVAETGHDFTEVDWSAE